MSSNRLGRAGELAFDKVTGLSIGEDAVRFLAAVPILKLIDSDLDKVSAETWGQGKAKLGDEPCELLSQILTTEHRETIDNYIRRYHVDEKDMWQNCNLLALQLTKIRDLSAEVRTAKASGETDLEPRRALVAEHEKLSILAAAFAAFNPSELATALRAAVEQYGDSNLEAIRAALNLSDKQFKLGPTATTNSVALGSMLQALDDANDIIVDLQSEVDKGRISPNRFILKMKEAGIDPKNYLEELKTQYAEKFKKHKALRGKDIKPEIKEMILEDIGKHKTEVQKLQLQYALRGESIHADNFPTFDVDLDPEARKGKMYGSMSFTQRLGDALKIVGWGRQD